MSQVWEYIKIALMNIRSNKGRSVLTMLGIIIGISSVIMIISVGNGIKSEVNGELNDMAGGQVAIYTDMQQNQEEQVFFSEEDFDAIQEKVAHVKSVTPVYNVYGSTPIQDEYIEKYLAEKELDLTATLDAKEAYSDADFVVIAAPTNVYSTNRIDVALPKRTCFAH